MYKTAKLPKNYQSVHKMKRFSSIVVSMAVVMSTVFAADPTDTHYNISECQGSLRPYPVNVVPVQYPDSLIPVHINHVGRHGARYPSSAANCLALRTALSRADSLGTITSLGRDLMKLNEHVIAQSTDRWGALDSLGMAEQRGIASRMLANYLPLFTDGTIDAISSYSPRAMMSMYCFVHQLDRLNNKLEFITSTGRVNSPLMRPFDVDKDYIEFRKEGTWKPPYDEYFSGHCPTSAIERVLGGSFPYGDVQAKRELAIAEYYVIAGMSAMSVSCDPLKFFTEAEYNALWSCFNLRQYLQRTASTLSTVPADIAGALVLDIINTTDAAVQGTNPAVVNLRFGHAETIMPLASLLHLPGCYYMTNYFDTVGLHWRDFDVVPMASNIQMILFRNRDNGRFYLRVDLNERPVKMLPNNDSIYIPWGVARDYMMRCVPLYMQ